MLSMYQTDKKGIKTESAQHNRLTIDGAKVNRAIAAFQFRVAAARVTREV